MRQVGSGVDAAPQAPGQTRTSMRLAVAGNDGTGVLLADGRSILTAAHVVAPGTSISVRFETTGGVRTVQAAGVAVHPAYDAGQAANDITLVWLDQAAPLATTRHRLHREALALDSTLVMVGYGDGGTGAAEGLIARA